MEVLVDGGLLRQAKLAALLKEANELTAILVASRKTAGKHRWLGIFEFWFFEFWFLPPAYSAWAASVAGGGGGALFGLKDFFMMSAGGRAA
jgi:hypothetical protein